jgi:putative ATP-dependent endonuclease of the OLD family
LKLVAITVKNFRSITKAYKLQLGAMTVLIGRNNEGKSNILRAFVAGLGILQRPYRPSRIISPTRAMFYLPTHMRTGAYNWETDYPIHLQESHPNGTSDITLEFELDSFELKNFQRKIGSSLNGNLPIKVSIGREELTVSIPKQGPAARGLTNKASAIADFVRERLDFQYIPAVRTAQRAHEVVEDMLSTALQTVENDAKYKNALKTIEDVQKPVLDQLSQSIKATLLQFLPAIQSVKVQIPKENRRRALRGSSEILIDDGSETPLKHKGDGVQSLAAIALMRHSAAAQSHARYTIIALEEPESHLHPHAIHELREVLQDIARTQQVIISTHCPLFVDRSHVNANIIVDSNKARSAKSIGEIREILGVRAADNLRHAELVLIVEGEDDAKVLTSLLTHASKDIIEAINLGLLVISPLNGASNLSYKTSLLRDALCAYHCYLDNDEAAHKSYDLARNDGLLTDAQINFTICNGMTQSEIEDMYSVDIYREIVELTYSISLQGSSFRSNKKWSDRMRETFLSQGKPWNDRVKAELKSVIADEITTHPENALNAIKRSSFDGLVSALKLRLKNVSSKR